MKEPVKPLLGTLEMVGKLPMMIISDIVLQKIQISQSIMKSLVVVQTKKSVGKSNSGSTISMLMTTLSNSVLISVMEVLCLLMVLSNQLELIICGGTLTGVHLLSSQFLNNSDLDYMTLPFMVMKIVVMVLWISDSPKTVDLGNLLKNSQSLLLLLVTLLLSILNVTIMVNKCTSLTKMIVCHSNHKLSVSHIITQLLFTTYVNSKVLQLNLLLMFNVQTKLISMILKCQELILNQKKPTDLENKNQRKKDEQIKFKVETY